MRNFTNIENLVLDRMNQDDAIWIIKYTTHIIPQNLMEY